MMKALPTAVSARRCSIIPRAWLWRRMCFTLRTQRATSSAGQTCWPRTVETIAGTGAQGSTRQGRGPGKEMELASPWDLAYHEGNLYIAMAGTHQLWSMTLNDGMVGPYAGTGPGIIVRWAVGLGHPGPTQRHHDRRQQTLLRRQRNQLHPDGRPRANGPGPDHRRTGPLCLRRRRRRGPPCAAATPPSALPTLTASCTWPTPITTRSSGCCRLLVAPSPY